MNASDAAGTELTPAQVLELLLQQEPFRFVDEILEVSQNHIVGQYRFRPDADFYRGHFPGDPVTPGVILLESFAQVGVVALGIYIIALEHGVQGVKKRVAFFSDANVDFTGIVKPGERVTTSAKKVFYRRNKFRAEGSMTLDDGTVVLSGTISGVGVER